MSKHIPEFYESILEVAERGELLGITSEYSQFTQLNLSNLLCEYLLVLALQN